VNEVIWNWRCLWNGFQWRNHFTLVFGILRKGSKGYYPDYARYSSSYRVGYLVMRVDGGSYDGK